MLCVVRSILFYLIRISISIPETFRDDEIVGEQKPIGVKLERWTLGYPVGESQFSQSY